MVKESIEHYVNLKIEDLDRIFGDIDFMVYEETFKDIKGALMQVNRKIYEAIQILEEVQND